MTKGIFISYRITDSAGYAGRLFDALRCRLPDLAIYMDVDDDHVELGAPVRAHLEAEVARSEVVLALIGRSWLDARTAWGDLRLRNPDDYVRSEIRMALNRGILVIPVMFDGARIPTAGELPDDIRGLADRLGVDIRHASFHRDLDQLIARLRRLPNLATDRRPNLGTIQAAIRDELNKRDPDGQDR